MHFISQIRNNPATGNDEKYYRIKESYRDVLGQVHSLVLLNVGFMIGLKPEEVRDVGIGLTYLAEHRDEVELFEDKFSRFSKITLYHINKFWEMIVEKGIIDIAKKNLDTVKRKAQKLIDIDTIEHTEARDVGAENVCLQALRQLELDKLLRREGWNEKRINTALAHLVVRTIYSPSELKSLRIMQDNSAVCELLSGSDDWKPNLKSIYKIAPSLYSIKDKLEKHLCEKTDNLFNLNNRIILFDLTNFYFEGRKEVSKKAKHGRSKEKRSDCKLLVLALCINTNGFIRYSSILEGNTADPNSLPNMIENIITSNPTSLRHPNEKVLVVIDAGISTEENLRLIKDKGYNYLCVARNKLKDYEINPNSKTIIVQDHKKQEIKLREIKREESGDYYLEINSPAKAIKEESMNRRFKERFETELEKAKSALTKKGGTKTYEKVIERVGKAMARYPSIAKHYKITYVKNEAKPKYMADIEWSIDVIENIDARSGIYFLRTNIQTLDEKTTWDYYNLIREIECTNRQLKNDLNLRPIYHQTDDNSDAHIFFGLLAYWIVNTIRYQLKLSGINQYWTEITRIMSTQKAVTTEATNALGEKVKMRICSKPTKQAEEIYRKLRYNKVPFKNIKICSTQ